MAINLRVYGIPGPQGSKRFVGHAKNGRGIMIESSKKVRPWRAAVKQAAVESRKKISGPVELFITFTLPRPKSVKRALPDRKPDLSKLVRSTEDALTDAGIWEDDARVVTCFASKHYVGDFKALDSPGASITIQEAA